MKKTTCLKWGSTAFIMLGLIALFAFPSKEAFNDQLFFESASLNSFANYAIGVGLGAHDFLVDNAECIFYVLRHPIESMREMVRAAIHYDETYRAVKETIVHTLETHSSLSVAEKGRLHTWVIGETLYSIGLITIPVLSLSKVEKFRRYVAKSAPKLRAAPLPRPAGLKRSLDVAEWFAHDQP